MRCVQERTLRIWLSGIRKAEHRISVIGKRTKEAKSSNPVGYRQGLMTLKYKIDSWILSL